MSIGESCARLSVSSTERRPAPSATKVADLHMRRKLQPELISCPAFVPSPHPHGDGERGTQSSRCCGGESPRLWRSVRTRARQLTP
jgi:hypothetical protein